MKLRSTAIALGVGAATAAGLSLLKVDKPVVIGSTAVVVGAGLMVARSNEEELKANSYFDYSDKKSEPEDYAVAIENYTKAIEKDPKNISLYENRAKAKIKLRNVDGAIEDYTKAIEIDSNDPLLYELRGTIFRLILKDPTKAVEDFKKATEIKPDYFDIRIKKRPKDAQVLCNRGLMLLLDGYYNEAFNDFSRAIELDQYNHDSYLYLGDIYRINGDYHEAIPYYDKGIDIDSADEFLYQNRGVCKHFLEDYQGAIEDFNKAISIDSTNGSFYRNKGDTYLRMGENKLAIADYTKAIEIDPKDSLAYSNRSESNFNLSNYRLTIEDCTKAIEIRPNISVLYAKRADSKDKLEEYKSAIDDYSKAIEIDSEIEDYYMLRGDTKKKYGDLDGAYKDWRKWFDLMAIKMVGSKMQMKEIYECYLGGFDESEFEKTELFKAIKSGDSRFIKVKFGELVRDYDESNRGPGRRFDDNELQNILDYDRDIVGVSKEQTKSNNPDSEETQYAEFSYTIGNYFKSNPKPELLTFCPYFNTSIDVFHHLSFYLLEGFIKTPAVDQTIQVNGVLLNQPKISIRVRKLSDKELKLAHQKQYLNLLSEDMPIILVEISDDEGYFSDEEICKEFVKASIPDEFKQYGFNLEESIGEDAVKACSKHYHFRGCRKVILGDHKGAIRDLDKSIQMNPKYSYSYQNRGIAKQFSYDYKGAVDDYSKVLEIEPENADTLYNRGNAKTGLQDFIGAFKDWTNAAKLGNESAARLLEENCQDGQPKEVFGYERTAFLPTAYNYYDRGDYRKEQGNIKGACDDWKKAAELGDEDAAELLKEHC